YDVVIAAGYPAWLRVEALEGTRRLLAPLARDEPSFHLPLFDAAFADADAIVVFGEAEEALVRRRRGAASAARVVNVGFALRVDSPGRAPDRYPGKQFVIARDWRDGHVLAWVGALGRTL